MENVHLKRHLGIELQLGVLMQVINVVPKMLEEISPSLFVASIPMVPNPTPTTVPVTDNRMTPTGMGRQQHALARRLAEFGSRFMFLWNVVPN